MKNETVFTDLLRFAVQVVGRIAIPPEQVRQIVATGKKHVRAFNLCDGHETLIDIAKKVKVDRGNLSRAASRWVRHGVAFWVGEGGEARLVHLYPIPETETRRGRIAVTNKRKRKK